MSNNNFYLYKTNTDTISIYRSGETGSLILSGLDELCINSNFNIKNLQNDFVNVGLNDQFFVVGNNKFIFTFDKSGQGAKSYFYQIESGKSLDLSLGNQFYDGNSVIEDFFNLSYKTGNLNLDVAANISGNLNVSATGTFNALNLNNIDNLSLSGVDITITSGVVALTNRPTVNGTGVLLSGENTFTVFMQVTNSNPANDSISYFNNLPGGPSTVLANKIFQIGEKCVARKASWHQYLDTFTGIPNQNATGYFINVTTQSTGVISTVINANTFGTSGFSYVSQITPNIAVNETDYVVCGLRWGNYTLGFRPSGWRAGVNIYCYN
jgi:hypothetical protein